MKCIKHPKYGAKRPPTRLCQSCWWLWFRKPAYIVHLVGTAKGVSND